MEKDNYRKNHTYIFSSSSENLTQSDKYAVLKLKRNINNSECCHGTYFNFSKILECMKCDNCAFKLVDNSKIIMESPDFKSHEVVIDEYLIEFFDDVDYKNIIEYLDNENSNYRVRSIKDNVIIRLCNDDWNSLAELDKLSERVMNAGCTDTTTVTLEDEPIKQKKKFNNIFKKR
jgi:hypothetical protein